MDAVTVPDILEKKRRRERIVCLTAYDCPTAQILSEVGVDVILVGDSLGNVILGYTGTVPVTMDEMVHHTRAVARGAKGPLLVADMPFMSYNVAKEDAVRNAGRLVKDGGAQAVKLEGGAEVLDAVEGITRAGIPVMGHVGLTPQTAMARGGYKVRGTKAADALRIVKDARALEDGGVFAVVLECVPGAVAEIVTREIRVPTIGIGAGPGCDGQILVTHDLVGLTDRAPRFVRRYIDLRREIAGALAQFRQDVVDGGYPGSEHTFRIHREELEAVERALEAERGGSGPPEGSGASPGGRRAAGVE